MRKNILITGQPKSGKSTLLEKVLADIPNKVGFLTKEILTDGQRIGFEIQTHLGTKAALASVNQPTPHKFSKYFVDVETLDAIIPEVEAFGEDDLLYIDEIAPIELFSEKFKKFVLKCMDAKNVCIATVKQEDVDPFIKNIKKRKDVILVETTPENRDERELFVRQLLKKIGKARMYANEPSRFARTDSEVVLQSEHGTRNLFLHDGQWDCDCDFFRQHQICSHVIAVEEAT